MRLVVLNTKLSLGVALVVAIGVAGSGCRTAGAGTQGADPADTVRAWRAAVEKNDAHAAYALLSPRVRKDLSYSEFERQWKATADERTRQAQAMAGAPGETTEVGASAEVALADGKKTRLVREKKAWRLEQPLLTSSRASTPQEAMRLFATALEDRNFFAVMRLVTSTRK
jgi:hypothetical protein